MGLPISHDGRRIVLRGSDGAWFILNVESSAREALPGFQLGDMPVRFDRESRHLIVARTSDGPPRIERIDIASGSRSLLRELKPPEPSGIIHIGGIVTSLDGDRYAYSFLRSLSDLYLVEGIG
jgi:hypothetical protein